MELDPELIALLATPVEAEAVRVALMPKTLRAAYDRAHGTTPQSRSNALKRLGKKIKAIEN